MSKLSGKVAIVTGASKGIGAAIAKALSAEGASVVVNYASSKAGADKVVETITSKGGKAIALKADVSKNEEAKALIDETLKAFGRLDVLVNNSGVYEFAPLEEMLFNQHRGEPKIFEQKKNQAWAEKIEDLVENQLILGYYKTGGFNPFPDSIIDDIIRDRVKEQFGDHITLTRTLQAQGKTRQPILDYFARAGYVVVGRYLHADPQNLYFMPIESEASTAIPR